MAKNIVVFSDGTGQAGGEGNNTNIYKMFNMLEDRTRRQVVFYDPGLGTNWQKITGNIGGCGISENIQQCYRFIFEQYEAGDQIFLFGFSRGAATVRSLSSFIHYFGLLPQSRTDLISKAYDIYKITDDAERHKQANEFLLRHHNMWVSIRFLGCYDTVAALGLPLKGLNALIEGIPGLQHKFHNFDLSESVENACQALAIDEERQVFRPVLWNKKIRDYQTLQQVWFCGMHSDVGGGYPVQTLSDIPLVWMTRMGMEHGLLLYSGHKVKIAEDANGLMHDSRGEPATKLFRREVRRWDKGRGKPVVHQSVLDRAGNPANNYHPWILSGGYDVEPWVHGLG
ncbi:MAG: DUF2235 domain-containing protein [Kiritimatiellales bacterium]|jgi:uncharacterized protein (DUF2235 family)